jgi:hypothetical protein
MALTLAEFIEQMNAALPRIPRHPSRGMPQSSRWDGHNCHCVIDLEPKEIDHEACPSTLHAQVPDEA